MDRGNGGRCSPSAPIRAIRGRHSPIRAHSQSLESSSAVATFKRLAFSEVPRQTAHAVRLRLRDNPREWRKFSAVAVLFGSLVSFVLWRRGWISDLVLQIALAGFALALTIALVRPAIVRPAYLVAMRFSHAIGQVMGRVLLVFSFLVILTPISLVLRLLGYDLLQLRRQSCESYWKPARKLSPHDRAF
jgi:hypothetical protein